MKEEMFHGNPTQQGIEIRTQQAQSFRYTDKEVVVYRLFVLQITTREPTCVASLIQLETQTRPGIFLLGRLKRQPASLMQS